MAKYKNMTNRPLPVELVGRSLSVGARKEFDVEPQEVSSHLRSMLGNQVRCISPDPIAKPVVPMRETKKEKRHEYEVPEPALAIPEKEKKDDEHSLTTEGHLGDPGVEGIPPKGRSDKKEDRKASRADKGGR